VQREGRIVIRRETDSANESHYEAPAMTIQALKDSQSDVRKRAMSAKGFRMEKFKGTHIRKQRMCLVTLSNNAGVKRWAVERNLVRRFERLLRFHVDL